MMKKLNLWAFVLAAALLSCEDKNTGVVDLTTEMRENPVGLDELRPRLSWKLRSAKSDAMQTGYPDLGRNR